MTIPETIFAEFVAWTKTHPSTPCKGVLKQKFVKEQLEPAYRACGLTMPKATQKLLKLISYQMRRARRTVIKPNHTRNGLKQARFGDENSFSGARHKAIYEKRNAQFYAANSQKNNLKRNQKTAAKNNASTMAYLQQFHPEIAKQIFTDKVIENKVLEIVNDPSLFQGSSLMDMLNDPESQITFYVGMTKRVLELEDLRFLTERGRNSGRKYIKGIKHARNRPVLLNANGSVITRKNAVSQFLNFKSVVVFENPVMSNATAIEAALQTLFQKKKLGYERLWRHVAKGQHHSTELGYYKVFFTYSFDVVESINNKKIIINK
jgi:hypothetical protein